MCYPTFKMGNVKCRILYKYEQIVVKFMCEFFGCDYCVLLTVNMLCHVEVLFIQLLNLLERYYVYAEAVLPYSK